MIVSLTGKPFVFFFRRGKELEMRYRKRGGRRGAAAAAGLIGSRV